METKICQNCKRDFVVESEDFDFYGKMKVPLPTWCWSCRMARRMNFRNERTLYKRKCDVPGHNEDIFSAYSAGSGVVYDDRYWWGDDWNPIDFGRDYDFNQTFFKQFGELFAKVPRLNLTNKNNHNCEYANWLDYSKNCYLVFGGGYDENVSYANRPFYTKDSMDIYFCNKVEFCYENVNCQNSYKLSFGENCNNCVDSCLMYDCKNCSDCFGCVGLRNKQHCIFNVEYSKEEYEQKIKELNQGSSKSLENAKKTFEKLKLTYPRKFANVINVQNTTGDFILDAKNCQYIFDCADGRNENSKFGFWVGAGMKDMYDGVACGVRGELLYESVSTAVAVARVYFSIQIRESQDIYYSIDCHNSSNLFGCVALRNKKYCILNNQYTK